MILKLGELYRIEKIDLEKIDYDNKNASMDEVEGTDYMLINVHSERQVNEDWNKKEVFFDFESYGHIFRVEAKEVTISRHSWRRQPLYRTRTRRRRCVLVNGTFRFP